MKNLIITLGILTVFLMLNSFQLKCIEIMR